MHRRDLLAIAGATTISGIATVYGGVQRNREWQKGINSSTVTSDEQNATTTNSDTGNSTVGDSEGLLVFTYDDSPIEDYTLTYEIHQEYDVPGCIAACPGLMQDFDAFLTPAQLHEMYEDGWDVLAHTYDHRVLGRIPLIESADEGDDKIYVEAHRHGAIEEDPLVVFDAEHSVSTSVAGRGSDEIGEYIELVDPVDEPIDASGYVRHPEAFMRDILTKTDTQLESWGIDVAGFVYTYGRYHGIVEDLVRDHYDAVPNHRYGGGHNDVGALDPTAMQRMYIETDKATTGEIDHFMAAAADKHVLSIVAGHSQFETFTEDRLRYTLETALEYDLEIVTIDEALTSLNNRD